MKKFTADFETCTWLENETYVWAWATCEIGNEENLVLLNIVKNNIMQRSIFITLNLTRNL